MKYFISGHRDLTIKEFQRFYAKRIIDAVLKEPEKAEFVVGDYYGADAMAQQYLYNLIKKYPKIKVTVYHMFELPRNNLYKFPTIGGFKTDFDRDCQMTLDSDIDIAWVRYDKNTSGTYQNVLRRKMKNLLFNIPLKDAKLFLLSLNKIIDRYPVK